MSLRDGTKKMSKSDPSDYSRINLTDDADAIAQKIRKAKTDADALPAAVEDLEKRPEADNLITIFAALEGTSRQDVLGRFAGRQFSDLKGALVDLSVAKLGPITAEMNRLMKDPAEIDRILKRGAERAGAIAETTMAEIKDTVGLLRF
jgi:tryptophanyl-tRNA synthetase